MLPGMCGVRARRRRNQVTFGMLRTFVLERKNSSGFGRRRVERVVSIGAAYSPGSRAAPVIAHTSQLHLVIVLDSGKWSRTTLRVIFLRVS